MVPTTPSILMTSSFSWSVSIGSRRLRLELGAELLDPVLERRDRRIDVGLGLRHVALMRLLQVFHLLLEVALRGHQAGDGGEFRLRFLALGLRLELIEPGLNFLDL